LSRLVPTLSVTLVLGLLVLSALWSRRAAVPEGPAGLLEQAGLHLALPPEAVLLRRVEAQGDLSEAVFTLGADRLRVRITPDLEPGGARELVEEERYLLDDLFEDRQAPYPGQLTNTLRCPARFRPKALDPPEQALDLVTLFANDRLGYGGCSLDLLRYHASMGFFYGESSGRLYRIEYFSDLEDPHDAGLDLLGQVRVR